MVLIQLDHLHIIGELEVLWLFVSKSVLIMPHVNTLFMVSLVQEVINIVKVTLLIVLHIVHLVVGAYNIEPTLLVIYPRMLSRLKVTSILR